MKLDKFMCGIDGKAIVELLEESRRLQSRCSSAADVNEAVVLATVAAAAAAATASTLSKVLWGSLSMSQVG